MTKLPNFQHIDPTAASFSRQGPINASAYT